MVIFYSYVSLPEGNDQTKNWPIGWLPWYPGAEVWPVPYARVPWLALMPWLCHELNLPGIICKHIQPWWWLVTISMKPIEIVDLPTENCDFPTSYVAVYQRVYIYWLVVWNHGILWFSIYWKCHHPNWRFLIFFRGVGQPPTRTKWCWRYV